MRLRLVLTALVVLSLVPTGDAAAAGSARKCAVKGSKTVASNRYARVFTVRSGREDYGDILYGCMLGVGKRMRLAEQYDDGLYVTESFDKVRLNGRMVVWQSTSTDVSCKADCPPGYESTSFRVAVADLRSRKIKGYDGEAKDALFVTRRGTPAWLEDATGGVEVHAGTQVLDVGAIDSLALRGNLLSWTNAGQPESAVLR